MIPYWQRAVGCCQICQRELLGWEASHVASIQCCAGWWVYDDTGERLPFGFGNEVGPKPAMHIDATCADEAERRSRAARKRGMAGVLL